MTDGVSAAYRDNISMTDLLPNYVWRLARDIVVDSIDMLLSNMLRNPESFRRSIKYTYNMELNDHELRLLSYALHYLKMKLYETIG